jgi:transcriptional regulator with XRE-family HTH domain
VTFGSDRPVQGAMPGASPARQRVRREGKVKRDALVLIMKERGVNAAQLAQLVNTRPLNITRILREKTEFPHWRLMERIAEALSVDPSMIVQSKRYKAKRAPRKTLAERPAAQAVVLEAPSPEPAPAPERATAEPGDSAVRYQRLGEVVSIFNALPELLQESMLAFSRHLASQAGK